MHTVPDKHGQVEFIYQQAVKQLTPLPLFNEQNVIFDEYNLHVSQFSIEINRILCTGIMDEQHLAQLLRLLAGMFGILKTTLLSPNNYAALVKAMENIEVSVVSWLRAWSSQEHQNLIQAEDLFNLAWYCDAAIPRALLASLILRSCPKLWCHDGKALNACIGAYHAIQHPLKGIALLSHLNAQMLSIWRELDDVEEAVERPIIQATILSHSVDIFTSSLKLFVRWPTMGEREDLNLRDEERMQLFETGMLPILEQTNAYCTSIQTFEDVFLPVFVGELINSNDVLAQTLIFNAIVTTFPVEYIHQCMDTLIRSFSQIARDVDINRLLRTLFEKVLASETAAAKNADGGFFSSVWSELAQLIKNRCDVEPKDMIVIASAAIQLAKTTASDYGQAVDNILLLLAPILKNLRASGFHDTSMVGEELVKMIREQIFTNTDAYHKILQLKGVPAIMDCLEAGSSRRLSIQLAEQLTVDMERDDAARMAWSNLPCLLDMFGSLARKDLMQMFSPESASAVDDLARICADLESFAHRLPRLLEAAFAKAPWQESAERLYRDLKAPNCTLYLFVAPILIDRLLKEEEGLDGKVLTLIRQIITSLLQNTSSTVSYEQMDTLNPTSSGLVLIQPEHVKSLAVEMNMRVAEFLDRQAHRPESSEFYSDVLMILSQQISQEQVKQGVMMRLLGSLGASAHLRAEDRRVIVDSLASQAGTLLRKEARCDVLLQVLTQERSRERRAHQAKAVHNLLGQLMDAEGRVERSIGLLSALLAGGAEEGEDEELRAIFTAEGEWLEQQSEPVKQRHELQLYAIRMRLAECRERPAEDGSASSHPARAAASAAPASPPPFADLQTPDLEEDLRRLQAFQSYASDGFM